jgi:hypothetical protein
MEETMRFYNLPDMPERPDYMKTHVIKSNNFVHIYWNYFRRPYKKTGIQIHRMPLSKDVSFVVYFGTGEFVISFRGHGLK